MGIRTAQQTLDQLYAVRDDLLTGKLASYSVGDRQISLLNINDLNRLIHAYESAVTAGTPIYADLSGTAHLPFFPEG